MKKLIVSTLILAGSLAMADVYQIDPAASRVEWKAGKKIGSYHVGDIQVKSGQVETDKKGTVKTANVVVDMKTIANEDLKGDADSQKKLVGHLSSEDFFKVEQYPESSFVLKSIKPKAGSKDEYIVKGDFTMIGKTEAVEFPAKITQENNSLKGVGTLVIERLKWGLKYGSGSIFKSLTADKIINDSFELKLNLVANKK